MSVAEFFEDIAEFNFSHAGARFKDWWSGTAYPGLKALVAKAETDEGKILENLVALGVKDVAAGNFSTASFVAAGKDILAQLIGQNIDMFNMQWIMAALNAEAAPVAPAVVLSVTADSAPVADTSSEQPAAGG